MFQTKLNWKIRAGLFAKSRVKVKGHPKNGTPISFVLPEP